LGFRVKMMMLMTMPWDPISSISHPVRVYVQMTTMKMMMRWDPFTRSSHSARLEFEVKVRLGKG
jgi:hypothetical protein